jgi:hypothetical protein
VVGFAELPGVALANLAAVDILHGHGNCNTKSPRQAFAFLITKNIMAATVTIDKAYFETLLRR